MEINSVGYWNHRFETDWNEFGGDRQTIFFANILWSMLPQWFIKEVSENNYSICDLGCAGGDALPIWRDIFKNAGVCGEDFAESAVANARRKYPEFMYLVSDIMKPEETRQHDVIISSNTVEHFKDTKEVLSNICKRSKKYTVIMLPYREDQRLTDEHEVIFHTDKIPYLVDDNVLIYAKTYQCNSQYYPGEQILLIYSKKPQEVMLSEITEYVSTDAYKRLEKEIEVVNNKCEKLENENVDIQGKVVELENSIRILEGEKARLENSWSELESERTILEDEKNALKNDKSMLENEKTVLESKVDELNNSWEVLNAELYQVKKDKDRLQNENESLEHTLEQHKLMLENSENKRLELESRMSRAINMCIELTNWGLYKFSHMLHRTKHQFFNKSGIERRKYLSWIANYIKGNGTDTDNRFKPIYRVIDILKQENTVNDCTENFQSGSGLADEESRLNGGNVDKETGLVLGQDYTHCDVIFLGVIDYDFRFQRPQQLAVRYARNGHRVFYFNANFYNVYSIFEPQKNLHVVNIHNDKYSAIYLTDWESQKFELMEQIKKVIDSKCIRDAIVIVDYPNWIRLADALRKEYGFKVITDYMDDYTGFINSSEELVKQNCEKLLRMSDGVIASSQFLYDIAVKYNKNVEIIRNGTEFDHFNSAFECEAHERKIIGYYGAVAEWFQADKVVYLAEKLPECDLVLIGDVTKWGDDLRKYSNIKLLGEKPYNELPAYLKDFDVCIIPFDTSTDLIKATNPVKFYEYLSAGKKVVSTEIPELEQYSGRYVYMANDNEKFLEYVKMCISGTDTLCSADECVCFAKKHDWQERYERFYEVSKATVPKVDIIVLTYNSLEINKLCIRSILEKTAYLNYKLIIVDNCSTDGTREYLTELEAENSNIKVILNQENLGFAAGNNVGMKEADGEYIVLLNNDTVVTRGWLTALTKHMENNRALGMCGPVTNSIGNEAKINVDYHTMGELERFSYNYTTVHLSEEYCDINVLAFFCTMIRKQVVERCGYLDETYGIGMFEDDDYAEAVKAKGYSLVIAEDAFVHHFHGESFKKLDNEQSVKLFNANKEKYEKKWNKKWTPHKYRKGLNYLTGMDGTLSDEYVLHINV